MGGASIIGWIVAVVAWSMAVLRERPIAGFAGGDVAAALALLAVSLMATGWAAERSRAGWRAALGAVAVWAVLVGGLAGAFLHRDTVLAVARSLGDEAGLFPPKAIVGEGGEVTVVRRSDGSFAVPARVNGQDIAFLFDTGASTVVLGAETARLLGLAPDTLAYRVPVATANGRGLAAAVTLDRLAVGPIEMRRVPALVVKSGLLEGNLLGQTFLENLDSYEVRGRRLVLRARRT